MLGGHLLSGEISVVFLRHEGLIKCYFYIFLEGGVIFNCYLPLVFQELPLKEL